MADNFYNAIFLGGVMEDYCKYQQRLMEAIPVQSIEGKNAFLESLYHFFSLFGLKTFYGLKMQVAQLCRQDQPIEALNLLLDRLNENHFWGNHAKKWWELMRIAVAIAQDLHLDTSDRLYQPLQKLLKLCMDGPQPWQGYNVAYSFVSLSLWSFQRGKTQKALEQVNIAIHADPFWGYPEYLLGWYGLILEGIDPVPHFVRAIQINWNFFQKLKQDPLSQHFPETLQAVKQKILVEKNNSLSIL